MQQRKIYRISKTNFETKDTVASPVQASFSTSNFPSASIPLVKSPAENTAAKPATETTKINANIPTSERPSNNEEEAYRSKMKKLNESFLSWITKQEKETIWTDAMDVSNAIFIICFTII